MIASEKEPGVKNDTLVKRTELGLDRLVNRFQGGKAIADEQRMPAQDLIVPVVNKAKEPAAAFSTCPELLAVRAPHPVRMIGADRAVVMTGRAIPARTNWSQKVYSFIRRSAFSRHGYPSF